ncbi:MAG TPA: site-2 protease family protein [Bryobacteraceae bacterium]|nr:site-2 protease family protein [Bryobacteraceae bacterium]
MFGRRVRLFELFGFEVRVDASWLIIAALVIWSLALGVFPHEVPGLSTGTYWWMGVVGALGLFGAIVVHELCHSLVARQYDLPMRGITLFIFGGVAEMTEEPRRPGVEFLMAIAGPIASIVIGLICYGLARAGHGSWPIEAVGILAYLAWINFLLAAFNLIPAFPLDGGRVLRSVLWHFQGDLRRATRIASVIGTGFGVVLMAFGVYEFFFGNFIAGIWYFLIGMFLQNASRMSYQQVLMRSVLAGEPIERFMRRDPVTVPPDISIQDLVERYLYQYDFKMFPVVDREDHLEGCVTPNDIQGIPKEEWPRHRVEEVTRPCAQANTIGPDADAMKVLNQMQETGQNRLLVTERDHLLAVVSARDLMRFLATKMNLEGPRRLGDGSRS